MLAQIRAATIAATRTPALPDSVCRKARSGAARERAHSDSAAPDRRSGRGVSHGEAAYWSYPTVAASPVRIFSACVTMPVISSAQVGRSSSIPTT